MARWRVQPRSRRFDGPGPSGADVSHGENVYLKDEDGTETKITVWFANGYTGSTSAREAVREWLDKPTPPPHLVVTNGGVSVIDAE